MCKRLWREKRDFRPGRPTRRRSFALAKRGGYRIKASPLLQAPSVTVDRLNADMDDSLNRLITGRDDLLSRLTADMDHLFRL